MAEKRKQQQHSVRMDEILARDFIRDERVQRMVSEQHVQAIRVEFDIDALGAFIASEREDGSKHLIDGGHRHTVVMEEGLGDSPMFAVVHTGLSLAEEARLFLLCNRRKAVDALDRFRLAVIAEDPESMILDSILTAEGFTTEKHNTKGERAFYAIAALQAIYRGGTKNGRETHPKECRDTLHIIMEAWKSSRAAERDVVSGIGNLLLLDGKNVDQAHLIDRLAREPSGVDTINVRSKYHRTDGGMHGRRATRKAVVEIYNRGLAKGKKLSEE